MKILTGKVTALKQAKTATILVERVVIHPKYNKRYKRQKKYQVHDTFGVGLGDIVSFVACKPISKTKKWKVILKTNTKKGKTK